MYYEVKNKTSSTLVQLTVGLHFFNETKRTAMKFEGLEKENNSNSLSKFYWLSSSALQNQYILINFFCLLYIQAVSDVGPYQTIR